MSPSSGFGVKIADVSELVVFLEPSVYCIGLKICIYLQKLRELVEHRVRAY
jgi:hypothetical protein